MKPRVTAGLMWQPEMGPMAYTRATNTKPKARAVVTTPAAMLPVSPMCSPTLTWVPKSLKPKDSVATPTATTTSTSVPRNSATSFLGSNVMTVTSCVQAREVDTGSFAAPVGGDADARDELPAHRVDTGDAAPS